MATSPKQKKATTMIIPSLVDVVVGIDPDSDKSGVQVQDKTEWHNIVCFGKLADVVEKYVKKGSKIYVEGKMRTRQYDDKNGVKRSIMEINAESIILLDNRQPIAEAGSRETIISTFGGNADLPF